MTQALADGFADATRTAVLVAAGFLVLGLIGALRVRAAARNHPAAPDAEPQLADRQRTGAQPPATPAPAE